MSERTATGADMRVWLQVEGAPENMVDWLMRASVRLKIGSSIWERQPDGHYREVSG